MSEIRVNNITNRDGSTGTTVAGIPVVDSNSHFVVPTGRTGQRYVDGGENIVRDGLVLYYDVKYSYPSSVGIGTTTSGATASPGSSVDGEPYTLYDLSGNEKHIQLVNTPAYNTSGYLIFNRSNPDYGESPTLIDGTTTVVSNPLNNILSYTFFANVLSSSSYYLISSGGQTGQAAGIAFSYQAGSPFAQIKGLNGGFQYSISSSDFPLNTWIGWGVVCDGNILSVYKNGVFLGSQTTKNSNAVSADNYTQLTLAVPNNNFSTTFASNMQFSNLQIYNRALSAAEVSQNFEALRSRFGI